MPLAPVVATVAAYSECQLLSATNTSGDAAIQNRIGYIAVPVLHISIYRFSFDFVASATYVLLALGLNSLPRFNVFLVSFRSLS